MVVVMSIFFGKEVEYFIVCKVSWIFLIKLFISVYVDWVILMYGYKGVFCVSGFSLDVNII